MLKAIANADEGAVLFHCGAGWDRTGLVVAVLLKALDVTSDAAVDDYLASFENADEMAVLHGRSFDVEKRHEILGRFGHSAESAYRSMYDELDLEEWYRRARSVAARRYSARLVTPRVQSGYAFSGESSGSRQ